VAELLAKGVTIFNGIKLIERSRILKHGFKRYTWMSETDTDEATTINTKNGFYILEPDESAIFYSYSDAERSTLYFFYFYNIFLISFVEDLVIELVILRGIGTSGPVSQPLYAWLKEVIIQACNERRNVRVSSGFFFFFSFTDSKIYSPTIQEILSRLDSILVHAMSMSLDGQRALQKLWTIRSRLNMTVMLLGFFQFSGALFNL